MQKKIVFFYSMVALLFVIACQTVDPIAKELEQLTTVEQKRLYLENLFEADQELRQGQDSDILIKHGKDSQEYRDFFKKFNEQDEANLLKIEAYLKKYGHPSKEEMGETATVTPWAIIHHASDYEDRVRNFPILYQAYQDKHIDDGGFAMYLNRTYRMKTGKKFTMQSPFKSADEIKALITALDLTMATK